MAHQNQDPNEAHWKHCYFNKRTGAGLQQVAGVLCGFRDYQHFQNPLGN